MKNIITSIQKLQNALELEIHERKTSIGNLEEAYIRHHPHHYNVLTQIVADLRDKLDQVVELKSYFMNV